MAPTAVTNNGVTNHTSLNGFSQKHADEMHTYVQTLEVDFEHFFGIVPTKMNKSFSLTLAEQSYLPKVIIYCFFGILSQWHLSRAVG